MDFQNFQKSKFVIGKFLKIRSFINLPWGHARWPTKNLGPTGISRFDFYWTQTDKQADKQSIYIEFPGDGGGEE